MLLYISGSYPASHEGIAAAAKILLDAMAKSAGEHKIELLTTNLPVIRNYVEANGTACAAVTYLDNWNITVKNIKTYISMLKKDGIKAVHMEYPGDCYGKTLLASFLPLITKLYGIGKPKIAFYVRLHEFTCARFLRKAAILPILLFADSIYVPALPDRRAVKKIAGKRVKRTLIGNNIPVCTAKTTERENGTIVISYFGSVYPGKGIERMLKNWKELKERDKEGRFRFKIIGEVDPGNKNHFSEYHNQVITWLKQYRLWDSVKITGYIPDEEVSREIQNTHVATLFYEDGLTLRRGSFLAYLAHGIPIVTSPGDEEAKELLKGHKGVFMAGGEEEWIAGILSFAAMDQSELAEIREDNRKVAGYFDWNKIADAFLRDYGLLSETKVEQT
ncbi:MAG: glycosyltransferase family 4 protein [Hungatella sp.]|nr:glycosyltransferase family 4 protein [Hungatella sp.]